MLKYHVSTWLLKVKSMNIFLCQKVNDLTLILNMCGLFHFIVKLLVEAHLFEARVRMLSSLGYMVSRVWGT